MNGWMFGWMISLFVMGWMNILDDNWMNFEWMNVLEWMKINELDEILDEKYGWMKDEFRV